MIELPLYYFLIAYAVFFLIFLGFVLVNAYHIYSTGTFTGEMLAFTIIMIALALITLVITIFYTVGIDWEQTVRFGSANLSI